MTNPTKVAAQCWLAEQAQKLEPSDALFGLVIDAIWGGEQARTDLAVALEGRGEVELAASMWALASHTAPTK